MVESIGMVKPYKMNSIFMNQTSCKSIQLEINLIPLNLITLRLNESLFDIYSFNVFYSMLNAKFFVSFILFVRHSNAVSHMNVVYLWTCAHSAYSQLESRLNTCRVFFQPPKIILRFYSQ